MDTENKHTDPVALLPKVFSGEATSEENRQVDEWLSSDPANREEFNSFARLWNITAKAAGSVDIDLDQEWQRMESAMAPVQSRTFTLTRIIQIAASVVLVSALAFAILKYSAGSTEKAPLAGTTAITLPEGSKVTLNAGSKITYRKGFGIAHRDLRLRGEAYFEVGKNAGLPFVVETDDAAVQVTGTKFNVKAYQDDPEVLVTVTEGAVRLYEKEQPLKEASLSAGETGIYNREGKTIETRRTENLNILAWKTHVMDFYNTPLGEVMEILRNTYHVRFSIDPALQPCSITVRFENQELDSVLNVLKSTLELNITKKGRQVIITGEGC